MLFLFLFLLLQAPEILSPMVIAIVTALFTIAVAAVGWQFLRDKVEGSSRAKGFIGALITAYGMIAPFISSFPRWLGVLVAVIGLLLTLFSARLHGPPES